MPVVLSTETAEFSGLLLPSVPAECSVELTASEEAL